MAGAKKPQIINLSELDLQGLTQLKEQLDKEIQLFTESLQSFKVTQMKFSESGACVEKITPESEGAEVLVPLSNCMYVLGNMVNVNRILIDMGTGYYVEKDAAGAIKFFQRKVDFLTDQMEKIQPLATEKNKLREIVLDMMQVKVQEHMAKMAQAQAPAKA